MLSTQHPRSTKLVGPLQSWVLTHPRFAQLFSTILLVMVLIIIMIATSEYARRQYWVVQIDFFRWLNDAFSSWPTFWLNMSYSCDALVLVPILSFLILVNPRLYAAFFGAIPLSVLLVHGGKWITGVPRPAAVLDNTTFYILGEILSAHNSLPSGHTATAFVAASVLGISTLSICSNSVRRICILTIATVSAVLALSRVAVGAHWPVDLAYGAMFGCVGAVSGCALTDRYVTWWQWLERSRYSPALGTALVVWSVALYISVTSQTQEKIVILYLASSIGCLVGFFLFVPTYYRASLLVRKRSITFIIKYPSVEFGWINRKNQ